MTAPVSERFCTKCGSRGPFKKDARRPGGESSTCKKCGSAAGAAYNRAHPDKHSASRAKWRANNLVHIRQYNKSYYWTHLSESKVRFAAWCAANPGSSRTRYQRWRLQNPEAAREWSRNRRAALAGARGTVTQEEWQEILEFFGHRCAYCLDLGVAISQDHIVPLARGGSHTADNVIPACGSCNSSKCAKSILTMVNA